MSNEFKETGLKYDPESPKRVLNWHWYKHQMTGWTKPAYWLLGIGIIIQLIIGLGGGITPLAITSTIAGILGYTTVLSMSMGKGINGITGLLSAILLSYVAIKTGNYSDVIMQVAYMVLLDIPILMNTQWTSKNPHKMQRKDVIETIILFIIFFVLTFTLDTVILHSPQAFLDAFAATIGLTGAVLATRQFRANYYFWTAQGLFSVALWIQTALHGHAVWVLMATYVLYLLNDLLAFMDSHWFEKTDKK